METSKFIGDMTQLKVQLRQRLDLFTLEEGVDKGGNGGSLGKDEKSGKYQEEDNYRG